MTTVLQENLSGMKVVKAFGAQSFEESKFNARANTVANLTYSATRVFASQGSLMTFIFTAAIGAILWLADGRLQPKDSQPEAWRRSFSTWDSSECPSG